MWRTSVALSLTTYRHMLHWYGPGPAADTCVRLWPLRARRFGKTAVQMRHGNWPRSFMRRNSAVNASCASSGSSRDPVEWAYMPLSLPAPSLSRAASSRPDRGVWLPPSSWRPMTPPPSLDGLNVGQIFAAVDHLLVLLLLLLVRVVERHVGGVVGGQGGGGRAGTGRRSERFLLQGRHWRRERLVQGGGRPVGRVHRERLGAREGPVAAAALVLLARHRRPDALLAQVLRDQRELLAGKVDEREILEAGRNVLVVVVAAPVRIQRLVAAEHDLAVPALGRDGRMLPVEVLLQAEHAREIVPHAHRTAVALAALHHRALEQVVVDGAHLAILLRGPLASQRRLPLAATDQLLVTLLELALVLVLLLLLLLLLAGIKQGALPLLWLPIVLLVGVLVLVHLLLLLLLAIVTTCRRTTASTPSFVSTAAASIGRGPAATSTDGADAARIALEAVPPGR
uniref:Uncharacterized protein n=1 Tax=Anopheles coluzzii TaxID=1518534 RepID=A0A8W7Q1B4_ANOCL